MLTGFRVLYSCCILYRLFRQLFLLLNLIVLVNFIICKVDLHLSVHKCNNVLNDVIRRDSEVLWRCIVCSNQALESFSQQGLRTFRVLHEVEDKHVIKVASNLVLVMKVKAVVEFRKF